jgi:hypothetical protein
MTQSAGKDTDDLNPECWMNVEPPRGATRAIVEAVRFA